MCVLDVIRNNYFIRTVYDRFVVWYVAHPRLSISKFLTELSVLWTCMSTAVRIMEANVQQKRSTRKKVKTSCLFYCLTELMSVYDHALCYFVY